MRFKYYIKCIEQMRYKKLIALFLFLIFFSIYMYVVLRKNIVPVTLKLCSSKAESIGLILATQSINNNIQNFKYDDLIHLNYDESGKLVTINSDIVQMNKLSSAVILDIQKQLLDYTEAVIKIPLGRALGWSIFSGYGPKLKIKIIPTGNVRTEFKSEFISQGINQTKHTVYIEIYTYVTIVSPFLSDTLEVKNVLNVAETIIIGDIPKLYMQSGVNDALIE